MVFQRELNSYLNEIKIIWLLEELVKVVFLLNNFNARKKDWVSRLDWGLSFSYCLLVVTKCLKISVGIDIQF